MRRSEACAPGTQLCRRCSAGCNWSPLHLFSLNSIFEDMISMACVIWIWIVRRRTRLAKSAFCTIVRSSDWCNAAVGLFPWIATITVEFWFWPPLRLTSNHNHYPIETCFQTIYRAQKQHVLRQQSEGAEGDGPAHQPDFQVPFIPFYVPGSFEVLFRYLQNRTRVSVWLYENVNTRIEGHITGDFELFLQEVQSMS